MISSCFLSLRLGLCSSGPIAYVVMEDFWRDGRREKNSHTALGIIRFNKYTLLLIRWHQTGTA